MIFRQPWLMRSTIQAATDDDIPSGATWAYGVDRTGGMATGIAADGGYFYKPWTHDGQCYDRSRYSMNLDSVDLTLVGCGAVPLLLEHREDVRLGTVAAAWISGRRLFVSWVWCKNEAGRQARRDVHSGILRCLSMGPHVGSVGAVVDEQPTPGRPGKNTVIFWELLEVSLARRGANPRAIVVNPGP